MLSDTFRTIRRSIVAFASLAVVTKRGRKPSFPSLIDTGFVVDSRGIVATNRHVVRALEKLPCNRATGPSPAIALTFSDVQQEEGAHSLLVVPVSIRRGLPPAALVTEPGSWAAGTPIATAGFPLGTKGLAIYGQLNQVAPILRSGIIASVYPFPCPRPHGFTIDIMTLGGESGSPIFLVDSGKIVGLLHAGFNGTNITLAAPSWLVAEAFDHYLRAVSLNFNGVPSFETAQAQSG